MTYSDLLKHIAFKDYEKLEVEILDNALVFKLTAPATLVESGENDLFAYKYVGDIKEQIYTLPILDDLGETLLTLLDDLVDETAGEISFQTSNKLDQISETLKFGR